MEAYDVSARSRSLHNVLLATGLTAMVLTGCENNVDASQPIVESSPSLVVLPSAIIDVPTLAPKPKPEDPTIALQRNLNNQLVTYGMPKLELDGKQGPQTKRALCAVRLFKGQEPSKNDASSAEKRSLSKRQTLSTPLAGFVISKTCQVMGVNLDGELKMIIPVSTGQPGSTTPSGSHHLQRSLLGWHNSSSHPDKSWRKANMFYPLYFDGSYAIHGSQYMSVDGTTPRSSGCVRVSVEVAPKLYEIAHNTVNSKIKHLPVHVF